MPPAMPRGHNATRTQYHAHTMAFSSESAQGAPARRRAADLTQKPADQASYEKRLAAMLVVAIDAAGMPVSHMLTSHREAALLAQLRPFPHHAGGNFRHVRDKIRTKPHGIAGAGLACLVAGLSSGTADAANANSNNQKTHRQSRAADKTQNTQHMFASPGSVRA
jgi:F0F1-type ATP synthase membrane subunit c/vacuolar-type H+-ATPase subunit K